MVADPPSDTSQIRRPGTGRAVSRFSRVSFATELLRSSTNSRRTRASSRAFYSAYAPPVPVPSLYSPKEGVKADDAEVVNHSPRQSAGPIILSPDDIRAKIQNGNDDDGNVNVLPTLASEFCPLELTVLQRCGTGFFFHRFP